MPILNTQEKISNPKGFIALTKYNSEKLVSDYAFNYILAKYYRKKSLQFNLDQILKK